MNTTTTERGWEEEQVRHIVNRFLAWKLPEHFNPDCGISFKPIMNEGTAYERRLEPIGTNLFSAAQAEAMIRYLLEGIEDLSEKTRQQAHEEGKKEEREAILKMMRYEASFNGSKDQFSKGANCEDNNLIRRVEARNRPE